MHQEIITRNKIIIRYNIAGILINLMLSVSKMITGIVISSQVIFLDGINSLSDLRNYFQDMTIEIATALNA